MSIGRAVAGAAAVCLVSGAALAHGTTPIVIDGPGEGGNRTCADVGQAVFGDPGFYRMSSGRVEYTGAGFAGSFPAGLLVQTDGTRVSFSSSFPIGAVIVKGGNAANVYVYPRQRRRGAGLTAPPNPSGKPAGLSNITFCWKPKRR